MDVSDVTYSIQIQTSSERGSGTQANIWVDLCGELGDTGVLQFGNLPNAIVLYRCKDLV